jgi:hypothetical protein
MMIRQRWLQLVLSTGLSLVAALLVLVVLPARSAVPHLGYGFNVAEWDVGRLQTLGFNWIKVFDVPMSPLPVSVLVRVEATAQTSINDLLADLDAKLVYKNNVQAWEIGNEVNIRGNADYGWNGSPDVAAYKALLCAAYNKIKSQSPGAIVVSAGLAPVGRLTNGDQIDERQYIQQLLEPDGGACLDVVGFHPYGYSADYDAAPDEFSADPTQNCVQGFCFRGAEKIYDVLQAHGAGDKKIWATEFGWITQPPNNCLTDGSWEGRLWQIVSSEKQASNLAGAYQYADAHWPWMGAMFIFNLNFYTAPWYTNECEQMLWYSVREGSLAEAALTNLVKNPANIPGRLKTSTTSIKWLVGASEQPVTLNASVDLANWGWGSLIYTATVDAAASLVPTIISPTGSLSATAERYLSLTLPAFTRTLGTYTGTLTLNWLAAGAGNNPRKITLEVTVVPEIYHVHLPAVTK